MNTVRKIGAVLVVALVVCGCATLFGCSSSSSSSAASSSAASSAEASSSASSDSASSAASNVLVLGDKTDTAAYIVFTNATDAAITNIAVLPAGSTEEPVMLMAEGQSVPSGEQVQVFVEPGDSKVFDAVVVCGDQRYTLHDMNLDLFNEATIRLEQGVAYLVAMINGSPVSSLQEETERANAQAAEQPAAEGGENVEEYTSNDYAENYTYSYDIQAPAQSEDACVSDIVLR